MPYPNYSIEVENTEVSTWIVKTVLEAACNDTLAKDPNIQTNRDTIRKIWTSLSTMSNFYSATVRFPETDSEGKKFVAINLDTGDFRELIGGIVSGAMYKAPDVSNTNKDMVDAGTTHQSQKTVNAPKTNQAAADEGSKSISSMTERDRLEKAVRLINKNVTAVLNQIVAHSYTRRKFERNYNLIWQA